MEDWLKWTLGGTIGAVAAGYAWLYHLFTGVDKRLAVMESRPYVDPIKYTESITMMASAIAQLTDKIAEGMNDRYKQYEDLRKSYDGLAERMESLADEVDVLVSKFEHLEKELQDDRRKPTSRSI